MKRFVAGFIFFAISTTAHAANIHVLPDGENASERLIEA